MAFVSRGGPTRFWSAALALLATLTACAPTGQSSGQGSDAAPAQPKVVTIAISNELESFGGFVGSVGGTAPTNDVVNIVHNYLVVEDDRGRLAPQLALGVPSVADGSWIVNADGTMDTTWRIVPNARWHDGTPFTTADLLFAFQAYRDPELPRPLQAGLLLSESATAPDPYTLKVHWSKTYIDADHDAGLAPLAAHLTKDLYQRNKSAFPNGPHFTNDFVGLGPYRLAHWEPGSHMELVRFDGYFKGRPPLDRVVVRFVTDANTALANILGGAVDVVFPPTVDIPQVVEIRRRWEGTGNQVLLAVSDDLEQMEIQHRPEYARPRNALTVRAVRQALLHATDRAAVSEASTGGLAPLADSWFKPEDPIRRDLERSIPQFPFDPARARTLLASAGWRPGSDGVLVHETTGERFDTEIRARDAANESAGLVIGNLWKSVGIQAEMITVPRARRNDREYESTRPGFLISNPRGYSLYTDRLHSKSMTTVANRWEGSNKSAYSNSAADRLFDALSETVDSRARVQLHQRLAEEVLADVPIIPLLWETDAVLALRPVQGIRGGSKPAFNIFEWTRVS